MPRLTTLLSAATLALGLTVFTPATSSAQPVSVGVNVGPVGFSYNQGYYARPAYYGHYAPYYRPHHHWFGPRPVVVAPAPAVVAPAPVVVTPPPPATVVVPARPAYVYPY